VEGAVAAADQAEQLLAVKVAVIRHLGPIVTEAHNGVIGNESSGKYDFERLKENSRAKAQASFKYFYEERTSVSILAWIYQKQGRLSFV
jgi:hypothetical protein